MPDIIEQLPDSVANQIAAGEVVQRPASVVKELLENAIDSGATEVNLIIKDAGKTLIRVIDNGCGMSDTDARMAFERHATSKIKVAEDLFHIRTKGFRGEALASIAAVAHVELKTRLHSEQLGTQIIIEGSSVQSQEACQAHVGSSFSVKNLFYNIPARRKFLKSDAVEMRHAIDEFQRVSLVHPAVAFSLHHNDHELFKLPSATLRQRIVNVFGAKYNQRLVPVSTDTDIVRVEGFIGKSEFARKTRGDQFLFVNQRFIKHPYLHHAITNAYSELIPKGYQPPYFIYLDVDPSEIDVNIHPTKTEIKFRDDRSLYAIIHSAVKQAIGKFNMLPSLDFEQETGLNITDLKEGMTVKAPSIAVNPDYNPFQPSSGSSPSHGGRLTQKPISQNWKDWYDAPAPQINTQGMPAHTLELPMEGSKIENAKAPAFQLHGRFIVTQIKSGMVIVDQQRAHERILYEQFVARLEHGKGSSQQLLFPQQIHLGPAEMEAVGEYTDQLNTLGFDIGEFGKGTILINGIPPEAADADVKTLIEEFIEQIVNQQSKLKFSHHQKIAASMAYGMSIKSGHKMGVQEMHQLIDELFACQAPMHSAYGKATILTFTLEDLASKF